MEQVIEETKQPKLGAASVINYLRGKGVKEAEIKWSGLEDFLSGKKSVTKEELLEYAKANRYPIFVRKLTTQFTDDTRWGQYIQHGSPANAVNYREYLYTSEKSYYNNRSSKVHWDGSYSGDREDFSKGVLAHARVTDRLFAGGGRALYIEEIQSDWHNAATASPNAGYVTEDEFSRLVGDYEEAAQEALALEEKLSAIHDPWDDNYLWNEADSDYEKLYDEWAEIDNKAGQLRYFIRATPHK